MPNLFIVPKRKSIRNYVDHQLLLVDFYNRAKNERDVKQMQAIYLKLVNCLDLNSVLEIALCEEKYSDTMSKRIN